MPRAAIHLRGDKGIWEGGSPGRLRQGFAFSWTLVWGIWGGGFGGGLLSLWAGLWAGTLVTLGGTLGKDFERRLWSLWAGLWVETLGGKFWRTYSNPHDSRSSRTPKPSVATGCDELQCGSGCGNHRGHDRMLSLVIHHLVGVLESFLSTSKQHRDRWAACRIGRHGGPWRSILYGDAQL